MDSVTAKISVAAETGRNCSWAAELLFGWVQLMDFGLSLMYAMAWGMVTAKT
jgi:hypothetical protein